MFYASAIDSRARRKYLPPPLVSWFSLFCQYKRVFAAHFHIISLLVGLNVLPPHLPFTPLAAISAFITLIFIYTLILLFSHATYVIDFLRCLLPLDITCASFTLVCRSYCFFEYARALLPPLLPPPFHVFPSSWLSACCRRRWLASSREEVSRPAAEASPLHTSGALLTPYFLRLDISYYYRAIHYAMPPSLLRHIYIGIIHAFTPRRRLMNTLFCRHFRLLRRLAFYLALNIVCL